MKKAYHLFEVYGIELEYMLVYKKNLHVASLVDALMKEKNGELSADVENGNIAWSNELVAHVVELKTNGPTSNLENLAADFHQNVVEINQLLQPMDALLLPTASHPLMNPLVDTQLWKHTYSEVYALYNQLFNCHGHGWSNVQSTHINLPFYDDAEFEQLHAAIRIMLPLIPGLCASSPIHEGAVTGYKDTRLEYYKTNQKEIPHLTGKVIPEAIFSKAAYHQHIFQPIKAAISPFDTHRILDHHFLNSRGAIARFDRNAIEIRLVDIQECPLADMAICTLIIEVIKLLVNGEVASLEDQKKWNEMELFELLNPIIKEGEDYLISNLAYLSLFGITEACTVQHLWTKLYEMVKENIPIHYQAALQLILTEGTLATRILKAVKDDDSTESIVKVYQNLAACLQENRLFVP